MSTPARALISLTRSLDSVKSDLMGLAAMSRRTQLTPVQQSRAKLLIQRRDQLEAQLRSMKQIDAAVKKAQQEAAAPVRPVLHSTEARAPRPVAVVAHDSEDALIKRLAELKVPNTPLVASPRAPLSDAEFMRQLEAVRPGSTPLPVPAVAYRTEQQKRELLSRELFNTTPTADALGEAGYLYYATQAYIKTGMYSAASEVLSDALAKKYITFDRYWVLSGQLTERMFVVTAKLRVMAALETSDPVARRAINAETMKMIDTAKISPDQKSSIHRQLKAWLADPRAVLRAPALPVATAGLKPAK